METRPQPLSPSSAVVRSSSSPAPAQTDAGDDAQLIRLWLHGKSPNTVGAYTRDIRDFIDFTGEDLRSLRLEDLQAYADELAADDAGPDEAGYAPATRQRKLAAVKSLLSFAHDVGYLPFNVGKAVKLPSVPNRLAERILSEGEVQRLITLEPDPRNYVLLRVLYYGALRVSEAAGLRWRQVRPSGETGQITVYGKGGKTRAVLLPRSVWGSIERLRTAAAARGLAGPDDAVFESRRGGPLGRMQIYQIVRDAAARAELGGNVSPHWMRHAHISHALDRGAPVHLVKETAGHASLATTSRYAHARPGDSSALYLPG